MTPSRRLLAIADDLSGAAEVAAAVCSRTIRSRVLLLGGPGAAGGRASALRPRHVGEATVLDLDSRYRPAAEAAEAVRGAIREALRMPSPDGGMSSPDGAMSAPDGDGPDTVEAPDTVVLKKIDSLLRGNVASEIAALAEGGAGVVLAPALPIAGRVVRSGVVHIGGVPLHEGDAWRAETVPPPASVAQALGGLPTALIPLTTVRASRPTLRTALRTAAAAGRVAICDAETDADLDAIVEASLADGPGMRLVGSGGLALAVGRHLATSFPAAGAPAAPSPDARATTGPAAPGVTDPAAEDAGSPATTDPATPSATDPDTPGATDPAAPDATSPAATTALTTPSATDPAPPGATGPAAEDAGSPATKDTESPATTDPATPSVTGPAAPGATDPAPPGATGPAAENAGSPATKDTESPATTDPATPSVTGPAAPGATDPAPPGATGPAAEDAGSPAVKDTGSQGLAAPGATGPAATVVGGPAVSGTLGRGAVGTERAPVLAAPAAAASTAGTAAPSANTAADPDAGAPSAHTGRPVLVVVGTAEPGAVEQVRRLVEDGAGHQRLPLAGLLADGPPVRLPALTAAVTVISLGASPKPPGPASAYEAAPQAVAPASAPPSGGAAEPVSGRRLVLGLARAVEAAVAAHRGAVDLVLTGGETARRVLDALAVTELDPVGQVHHGAVHLRTPDGRSVVTRPGSFGDPDSLRHIVQALRPHSTERKVTS
ncbi:four-carbon acid sugar kinase family protein [Streptomyces violaceusniger]|uniref:four-carbon acid sugar kinase family protein n=1 Tax=Streptomyces violaceusniger TaxID=68280 RepID=UPI0031D6CC82